MPMDMKSLLSETAPTVAEAAREASPTLPPITATLSAVAPTPTSFLAPTYAPPTANVSAGLTTSSVNAAAIHAAIIAPRPAAPELEDDSDSEEFDEDNPEWAKWNCNQIRTKIRSFLGTKEMTQAAWLRKCDINSNSYYRFMNLKGPYAGSDNQTYEFGAIFFYRRERDEKKKKASMKSVDKKRKATEQRTEKAKKSKDGDELLKRIAETALEDADENGDVPVFDDCDEIRKKINFFLGEGLVTKAAFLRALGNVNSNSLRSFINLKRGAGSGAANVVYRTAYIFFEKKRVLEGKKKTKKRLDNEAKQGADGFPLRHDNGMRWVITSKNDM